MVRSKIIRNLKSADNAMKRAPKIGTRVRYVGGWQTMKGVTGTVIGIRQTFADDVDEDGNVTFGPVRPQSEWSVSVRVDKRPANWPYGKRDAFAPLVREIEKA